MDRLRTLVLWNACRGISPDEDSRWVAEQVEALRSCDGVRDVALHQVEQATVRHARQWDWCLELELERPASDVLRNGRCSEFLDDLRLIGGRPSVLVLPGEPA